MNDKGARFKKTATNCRLDALDRRGDGTYMTSFGFSRNLMKNLINTIDHH